ncbi:MAG: putative tyrosine recombinase XerC-like protein [Methanoregulaceae archaeon PtaB.Bin056]|jgi:site-specific recombinase XerD|nr:MAG: putative tyrosine recombinase XerC-like protein [Methanoregulaceae archaeon PtaB.Bin056]
MPSKTNTKNYFPNKNVHDFHLIDRAVSLDQITRQDADLLNEFLAERRAAAGISNRRTDKLAFTLLGWRRFLPPFHELTIGRVYSGIESLKQAESPRGRPYKQNTIVDHVAILKQFLLWMIDNEYSDLPEKKVRAIKTPRKPVMTKTASQLITPDEIRALVAACRSSRDRALLMTLYEGGFRLGEISQITWGDLKVDSKGIAVNIDFKTGIPRYIRLIMAQKYLAEWRGDYPLQITPESPVFVSEQRRPVTWAGVAVQIRKIAQRAGIKKHITPHLFRHSRITHLLQEGDSKNVPMNSRLEGFPGLQIP